MTDERWRRAKALFEAPSKAVEERDAPSGRSVVKTEHVEKSVLCCRHLGTFSINCRFLPESRDGRGSLRQAHYSSGRVRVGLRNRRPLRRHQGEVYRELRHEPESRR